MGTSTGDDAAVWRVSEHRALVATVDFFTPLVDDARTWGRIAAANSASDVYAMGGTPMFALTVAAWPRDVLPLDLLAEALAGAADTAAAGGWVVAGGHTVDGPEPLLGQSVTGELDPARMLTNDAGRVGDVLVLTKPLGTGIVATAIKRSPSDAASNGWLSSSANAAIASMTRLNADASRIAVATGLRAGTDVTGFGLAGHLHKLALASGVAATIDAAALPVLPGLDDLIERGFVPGGTGRNVEFVRDALRTESSAAEQLLALFADPQTSGGLLLCVPAADVDDVRRRLLDVGDQAAVIGELTAGTPGALTLR